MVVNGLLKGVRFLPWAYLVLGVNMYIVDKNKDFYDYYGAVLGVDKSITYDRRGSTIISDDTLFHLSGSNTRSRNHYIGTDHPMFILEVGTIQYLFKVTDILYRKTPFGNEPYTGTYTLVKFFKENINKLGKEITLAKANRILPNNWWRIKDFRDKEIQALSELNISEDHCIVNPILRDTSLVAQLDAMNIWIYISNYISSKYNDKTITINNSDIDKLINHGFDKKISFRNPIK